MTKKTSLDLFPITRVMYTFESQRQCEISVSKNEIVRVIYRIDDRWVFVTDVNGGCRQGYIPYKYCDISAKTSTTNCYTFKEYAKLLQGSTAAAAPLPNADAYYSLPRPTAQGKPSPLMRHSHTMDDLDAYSKDGSDSSSSGVYSHSDRSSSESAAAPTTTAVDNSVVVACIDDIAAHKPGALRVSQLKHVATATCHGPSAAAAHSCSPHNMTSQPSYVCSLPRSSTSLASWRTATTASSTTAGYSTMPHRRTWDYPSTDLDSVSLSPMTATKVPPSHELHGCSSSGDFMDNSPRRRAAKTCPTSKRVTFLSDYESRTLTSREVSHTPIADGQTELYLTTVSNLDSEKEEAFKYTLV